MLCETCEKREFCSELCPEAEAYVNQDYVPPYDCQTCVNVKYCSVDFMESNLCKERNLFDIDIMPKELMEIATKSNEEIIIHLFFIERVKPLQIAKILNISHQHVYKTINKYKAILKKNLQK